MSETETENTPKAYKRPKEPTNFITYALAALLSFVGFVLLLYASLINASARIGSFAFFVFIAAVVFTSGALCHILPASGTFCAVCRKFDRCAVAVLIAGAYVPISFAGFACGTHADAVWGYALFATLSVATVLAVAVNIADVAERKILSLVFYVIIGWACVARAHRIADLCGWECFGLLLGGCAAYFVGTVICAFEGLPARHEIKHVFVIVGAAMHFAAIYFFVM